jgi:tRNA1Val (adenine37-N6)-methyltransferase
MPKEYFEFKQFTIHHDQCAMKVGTDGVLLGAWTAPSTCVKRILDIGTGSGLIAIMLAQKCEAKIIGIDIDENAIKQARENAARCTWRERLQFIEKDVTKLEDKEGFDLIVCNPPFFVNSLQCPDEKRTFARHSSSLPFESLIESSYKLLKDNGIFNVILPHTSADDFILKGWERGLNLYKRCNIFSKPETKPIRTIISLIKGSANYPETQNLLIRDENGDYTDSYKLLTKEYYLQF